MSRRLGPIIDPVPRGGNPSPVILATVRRDGLEARGDNWPEADESDFRDAIRSQYEHQGHPYYASARLWDDGIIDPADTRRVLGLGIAAALNAPVQSGEPFGVFRM